MISPLVKWDHSADWIVQTSKFQETNSCERTVDVSLSPDDYYGYMRDHVVDGKVFVPATGFVFLVWETISRIKGQHFTETPVVFEDIRFLRAMPLAEKKPVALKIVILQSNSTIIFIFIRLCYFQ